MSFSRQLANKTHPSLLSKGFCQARITSHNCITPSKPSLLFVYLTHPPTLIIGFPFLQNIGNPVGGMLSSNNIGCRTASHAL